MTSEGDWRVVVVGAGAIGAAVSYYLTQHGVKPVIVERVDTACAASGKAGGFLAKDWSDGGPTGPVSRLGFDLHRELASTLGKEYGYRAVSTLGVRSTEEPRTSPISCTVPHWVDGSVQSSHVMGDESSTAQVTPELYTKALVSAAEEKGAVLRIATVCGVRLAGTAACGVELEGGDVIECDTVVIAMGPWSGQAGQWLPQMPQVSGHKYHSIILKPEAPISAHALFLHHRDSNKNYSDPEVYPRPNGDVYVCGEEDRTALPADPTAVKPMESSGVRLHEIAGCVSSALKNAHRERIQACYLPTSSDGAPIMGPLPGVSGVFVATAHSCWGILQSPATGKAMAELIVEGKASCFDMTVFYPSRFC